VVSIENSARSINAMGEESEKAPSKVSGSGSWAVDQEGDMLSVGRSRFRLGKGDPIGPFSGMGKKTML